MLQKSACLFLFIAFARCSIASSQCHPAEAACQPLLANIFFSYKQKLTVLKHVYATEATGQNIIHRLNPDGSGLQPFLTVASAVYHIDFMNGWLYYAQGTALHRANVNSPGDTLVYTLPQSISGIRAENQGGRTVVYISENVSGTLHRLDPETLDIVTIVPSGVAGTRIALSSQHYFFADGSGVRSLLRGGGGLTGIDSATATGGIAYNPGDGLIYFFDSGNALIRVIDQNGLLVRTLSPVNTALALQVDALEGQVYFVETGNSVVRRISTAGGASSVLASVTSPIGVTLEYGEF